MALRTDQCRWVEAVVARGMGEWTHCFGHKHCQLATSLRTEHSITIKNRTHLITRLWRSWLTTSSSTSNNNNNNRTKSTREKRRTQSKASIWNNYLECNRSIITKGLSRETMDKWPQPETSCLHPPPLPPTTIPINKASIICLKIKVKHSRVSLFLIP